MGNIERHFVRVNNHSIAKIILNKTGNAALRLTIPMYFKSAGLVLEAYQQSKSHPTIAILTRNKVWLKSALMNAINFPKK